MRQNPLRVCIVSPDFTFTAFYAVALYYYYFINFFSLYIFCFINVSNVHYCI